jgi:ankyrin repeat protein
MKHLFADEDFFETRQFPSLHKIVLGINGQDLACHLQCSTSEINNTDTDGRTALSWAASRGDSEIVEKLLESKANPNIPAPCGRTPLHWACQSSSTSSIAALLKHAADVNAIDSWQRTALIYASCNHREDNADRIHLLAGAGASVNIQDCRERTALGYAAKHNLPIICQALLNADADMNLADNWGYKPIFEVLQPDYIKCLDVLFAHAKKQRLPMPLAGRTINGHTILHLMALHANKETMERFLGADFTGVDPLHEDDNDATATELLKQREDFSPDLVSSFGRLMERANLADKQPMHITPGPKIMQDSFETIDKSSGAETVNLRRDSGYETGDDDAEFFDAVDSCEGI